MEAAFYQPFGEFTTARTGRLETSNCGHARNPGIVLDRVAAPEPSATGSGCAGGRSAERRKRTANHARMEPRRRRPGAGVNRSPAGGRSASCRAGDAAGRDRSSGTVSAGARDASGRPAGSALTSAAACRRKPESTCRKATRLLGFKNAAVPGVPGFPWSPWCLWLCPPPDGSARRENPGGG